jgi:hypothetical protein
MVERPEDMPPEMAELPESWKIFPSGAPVPNWVAAVQEARDGLADGLIADRPESARTEMNRRYASSVTAKEKLIRDVLDLDEAKATRARIVVMDEPEPESETIPLPKGWDRMANGEPMPDVAAAVRRSREGH